ncbi:peptidase inhibitor family I36 protein [Streptomyces polygonati]|uniref:Peptidase inhibitor family I36 protein n=1 Tax=Streptomyces polygonati TaxID=1617087 RepID=A0ABV8HU77_9ACTN
MKPRMYAAAAAAAVAALLLSAPAADARPTAEITCPAGYVCIYPDINYGGQPWVKRAVDGSVAELPSSIRDKGSSIRNASNRTARVYRHRLYTGSHVCVVPGGSINDLRSYALNDQTRSLRVNSSYCGT